MSEQEEKWSGDPEFRVISLGAGVQSSVMSLMAVRGELKDANGKKLPPPDCAIFADTGWEPRGVYDHLKWLKRELKRHKKGFMVIEVSAPKRDKKGRFKRWKIQADLLAGTNSTGQDFISLPVYIRNEDDKKAMARRQCTREYKLEPIRRGLRSLMKLKFRERWPKKKWVEQWIGISADEITRMKDSRDSWCRNRWPLVDVRINRSDCIAWFKEHYPRRTLPRSACIGCPMRTDKEWIDMKENDLPSWREAIEVDKALRKGSRKKKFGGAIYLHRSMKPLHQVKLSPTQDKRNISLLDECEGMCGV